MTAHAKNLNIAELVAQDSAHHFHPFTDHKAFHAEGGARIMTQADGVWIWDAKGNKLLDGMAGLWCVNVGYGRKELAEAWQVPVGTIKSRVRYGLNHLSKAMERLGWSNGSKGGG